MSQQHDQTDIRRRRARFRAWHRGTREMDLLMGQFADATVNELSVEELSDFEALMEVQDRDVFAWISGESDTPNNYNTPVFRRLTAFHTHSAPLHN